MDFLQSLIENYNISRVKVLNKPQQMENLELPYF